MESTENIIPKSSAEQCRAVQSRAEQSRNPYIQIIRALCIFAVICIHTCPNGIAQVIARPFINFGVGVFLFLSGYLTREESWNWPRAWKRIKRVLVPYIVWTLIYTLLSRRPERLFYNIATASSAAQMYYILVYSQLVLLTVICCKLLQSKAGLWVLIIISPLSFLCVRYIQFFGEIDYPNAINVIYGICFIPWICYYVFGLWMRKHPEKYSLKDLIPLLIVSILLQIFEGYVWYKCGETNCGSQLKITSFITTILECLIFYEIIRRKKSRVTCAFEKFLISVGDYSFGIYLCHIAVMMVLGEISLYQRIPYIVNSIVVLLISLICCMVGDKICRRVRLGKTTLSQIMGLR